MNDLSTHSAGVPSPLTRRDFLGSAAVVAGSVSLPWIVPASARGADGTILPSERITVALIGHGLMGRGHLHRCLGDPAVQVLGVCDVDRSRREEGKRRTDAAYAATRSKGTYSACVACNDYRELLARPDLDAVLIATPDHWHTLLAIDAAKAGKDVYCEKPVSLTLRQGRRLSEVMRRYARVFQTGTQYRSMFTTRKVCNFIRAGGLGRIKQVFALWSTVEGAYFPLSSALPAEPVPDGLDWDFWVGPAPWRPYNKRFHRNPPPGVVPWAFCEDFGAASVTWHHSHSADVIQYALGYEVGGPVEILHPSDGPFPTLTYRYANGTLFHLVDHWGMVKGTYHAVPENAELAGNFGGLFVGERGWLTSMYGGGPLQGEPDEIFTEMGLRNRAVSGSNNHHANWLECIRTRGRPSAYEEIGHRSASLGHLAIIAFKLRRSLAWDPVKEEFDDAEANRLRSRAMREPWRL